jgi:hypothetical protein
MSHKHDMRTDVRRTVYNCILSEMRGVLYRIGGGCKAAVCMVPRAAAIFAPTSSCNYCRAKMPGYSANRIG